MPQLAPKRSEAAVAEKFLFATPSNPSAAQAAAASPGGAPSIRLYAPAYPADTLPRVSGQGAAASAASSASAAPPSGPVPGAPPMAMSTSAAPPPGHVYPMAPGMAPGMPPGMAQPYGMPVPQHHAKPPMVSGYMPTSYAQPPTATAAADGSSIYAAGSPWPGGHIQVASAPVRAPVSAYAAHNQAIFYPPGPYQQPMYQVVHHPPAHQHPAHIPHHHHLPQHAPPPVPVAHPGYYPSAH